MCDCWNAMNEISIIDNNLNQRAKDIFNVESYNVCVHSLLKCWKQHRKSIHDFESLVSERVYCVSNWQNKIEYWRHDCVLVQKWSDNIRDSLNLFNDWLADQLWIIMSVIDSLWEDDQSKWIQYTDTLVDLFKSQNNDCSHVIYDMIELCNWSEHVFKNFQFIDDKRFYTMSMIIWSVHIVSASVQKRCTNKSTIYYINNFDDWNSYNSMYKEDFLDKDTKIAMYYSCER